MATSNLREFFNAYLTAALWSSNDESDETGGEPMDSNYDRSDIAPCALLAAWRDCRTFYKLHRDLIEGDAGPAGHDFWLTRCGHGAGFWDGDWPEPAATLLDNASKAAGNRDLYVGDDGKIYGF